MATSADAFAQVHLKSAFRDQALVDKFTAIRGYDVHRGSADARATLTNDEVQVLQSLIARSSPLVQVMPNVGNSVPFGGHTKVEMVFRTTFRSRVQPVPPYRVIRFVRASYIDQSGNMVTESHTVPGYVHYDRLNRFGVPPLDPDALHASLVRCFTMSRWSFDGPATEFEGGMLVNEDSPGTNNSDPPYGIMADFLIALYDEAERRILEVGRATGWLCLWEGWPAPKYTFVQTR